MFLRILFLILSKSARIMYTSTLMDEMQDSPFVKEAETPVPKMLRKVENTNTRSIMSSQKQHSKVKTLITTFDINSQPHHLFFSGFNLAGDSS